jgi:glutamine synthetase adenylyltransferase
MKSVIERINSETPDKIVSDIKEMRKKIGVNISPELNQIDLKKSNGGLTDSEYTTHILILKNPGIVKKIHGKTIYDSSDLISGKIISVTDLDKLKVCYYFLKRIMILNQLFFNANGSKLSLDEEHLLPLAKFMKIKSTGELRKKIDECLKTNRELFSKYTQ